MKKLAFVIPLVSLSCMANEHHQGENYTVGLGLGSMYSGLGANLSFVSENDSKYVSAGCVEYSSIDGADCGLGAGWIRTDLFGADSNKHGLGVYLSIVGNESYVSYTSTSNGTEMHRHDSSVYGAGISYTYFMNGIDKSGVNFGVSVHATNADFEDSYGIAYQVGYQF